MHLKDIILSRRTVHTYNNQPVSLELLKEALGLGLWAPNHRLTYPWRFALVGVESRKKLAALKAELKAAKGGGPPSAIQIQMVEKTYLAPSRMVVLGMDRNGDPGVEREDYATIAMAVQNISLFLWQHGVGTKWSSGGATSHPRAYQILGINPEQTEIVGFLWVGRFDQAPDAPERPDLPQYLREIP